LRHIARFGGENQLLPQQSQKLKMFFCDFHCHYHYLKYENLNFENIPKITREKNSFPYLSLKIKINSKNFVGGSTNVKISFVVYIRSLNKKI